MGLSNTIPITTPHYPTGWRDPKDHAKMSRFGARFRIAKSFQNLSLQTGISPETADGYSKIIHVFLAYSGYEIFSKIFGLTAVKKRTETEKKYASGELIEGLLRKAHDCRGFVDFLKKHSGKDKLKQNIDNLYAGRIFSVILLGESIRHCFAHGSLTPSAWKSDPLKVAEFCEVIADFLIIYMDSEYSSRIELYMSNKERS